MTDWCRTKITATGPRELLERYREATFSPDEESLAPDAWAIDFNKVIPEPIPIPVAEAMACKLFLASLGLGLNAGNTSGLPDHQFVSWAHKVMELRGHEALAAYIAENPDDPLVKSAEKAWHVTGRVFKVEAKTNWRACYWNTRSNSSGRFCSPIIPIDGTESWQQLSCKFSTPWGPPGGVFQGLVAQWPGLLFEMLSHDAISGEARYWRLEGGKLMYETRDLRHVLLHEFGMDPEAVDEYFGEDNDDEDSGLMTRTEEDGIDWRIGAVLSNRFRVKDYVAFRQWMKENVAFGGDFCDVGQHGAEVYIHGNGSYAFPEQLCIPEGESRGNWDLDAFAAELRSHLDGPQEIKISAAFTRRSDASGSALIIPVEGRPVFLALSPSTRIFVKHIKAAADELD
jgi:hypothetical protein